MRVNGRISRQFSGVYKQHYIVGFVCSVLVVAPIKQSRQTMHLQGLAEELGDACPHQGHGENVVDPRALPSVQHQQGSYQLPELRAAAGRDGVEGTLDDLCGTWARQSEYETLPREHSKLASTNNGSTISRQHHGNLARPRQGVIGTLLLYRSPWDWMLTDMSEQADCSRLHSGPQLECSCCFGASMHIHEA